MVELLPFFIVLFAAVFFSELFFRFHFPWVVALLLGGIIIGPSVLDIFEPNQTLEFVGEIGLIFLMFMAGLETNLFKHHAKNVSIEQSIKVALVNTIIPFAVGYLIAYMFGFEPLVTLLIAVICISSSVAAVVPSLEARDLLRCKVGRSVVSVAIISDILSLIALSLVLQNIDPTTNLPLPLFYFLLLVALFVLRKVLPLVRFFFKNEVQHENDVFQQELRSIFVILIGTVVAFELLGLHPIIAGFFAGLVLSDTISSKRLKSKLHAISYGMFIPTFFIVIGAQTDFTELLVDTRVFVFGVVLTIGVILSKLISGYIGSRGVAMRRHDALIVAASTVPSLSTTLAVAFTGLELEIFDQPMVTALVALSMITTVVGTFLVSVGSTTYIREEVSVPKKTDDMV